MAAEIYRRSDYGAWMIVIASIVALAVSIYNYNSADSGIAGTPGAMLVMVSSFLLLVRGLPARARHGWRRILRSLLAALCFLGILGTGLAGYLLESTTLAVAMALCMVGWLIRLFQPRAA